MDTSRVTLDQVLCGIMKGSIGNELYLSHPHSTKVMCIDVRHGHCTIVFREYDSVNELRVGIAFPHDLLCTAYPVLLEPTHDGIRRLEKIFAGNYKRLTKIISEKN